MTDRLQQLERERVDIQELMRALDRVILSYDPDHQASALTRPEQGNRSRKAKPLPQLTTIGRVRQSAQFDGRKVLWEIVA
ncbi:hypothetical protein [Ensifer sp. YR511]|uniref:hypothetical protein n=1 Tax=Ensifer sp. YR511 TaxID=1855294 RepID=UPI0008842432|nr:hypothetical protein [Ensifer sp. YR511]SDO09019.1 hypothetical protein SAMN05216328_15328 [Ensifer sp. YR511]